MAVTAVTFDAEQFPDALYLSLYIPIIYQHQKIFIII